MGEGIKQEASQGRRGSSTFLRMAANEGLRSSTTSSGRNVNAQATQNNAPPSKTNFSLIVVPSHVDVGIIGLGC